MAGFFGLFGKKKDEPKDAFFLSPDESKTYGDIDYMRTSKSVRRTFVKTVGNPEGGEVVSQVSSERMVKRDGSEAKRISSFASSTSASESTPKTESTPSFTPPKKVDSSMDMFRNMAKKIKR
jgi:hypothetical protein